ncbi:hypothetical protein QBE52_02845 [Clostridiaceae bacterium 35-E11]
MSNNSEMMNLLEKIYLELQQTKKELKDEISENRKSIIKLESIIESEISDKIRGLYDSREVINDKLDVLDEKMDKMQFDVNNLTMKVAQSDNTIIELKRNLKTVK